MRLVACALLLTLAVVVAPCAAAEGPDPATQLFYDVPVGTVLDYEVFLFYDWTRTSSNDVAALAGLQGGGDQLPGQPWYAVHDPAEVEMRGRLEAIAADAESLRFRFTYTPAQVHFFDDTTQLKFDYAQADHRADADKRMQVLNDPRESERFRKVHGVIANPFIDQCWRVLAYSKLAGWSFEFSVSRRGGPPRIEGFAAGLDGRLPAFVPDEPRRLIEADAVDFLGMVFPSLPDRSQLAKGTWSDAAEGSTRYRGDGWDRTGGRSVLRFVNAERKSVTRRDDEDAQIKETNRLAEVILYSPEDHLVLSHEREIKSTKVENQRRQKDSSFGIGKSKASVRCVKRLPPGAAGGVRDGQ